MYTLHHNSSAVSNCAWQDAEACPCTDGAGSVLETACSLLNCMLQQVNGGLDHPQHIHHSDAVVCAHSHDCTCQTGRTCLECVSADVVLELVDRQTGSLQLATILAIPICGKQTAISLDSCASYSLCCSTHCCYSAVFMAALLASRGFKCPLLLSHIS